MGGMLGSIVGGALAGVGAGLVEDAKAQRDAALADTENLRKLAAINLTSDLSLRNSQTVQAQQTEDTIRVNAAKLPDGMRPGQDGTPEWIPGYKEGKGEMAAAAIRPETDRFTMTPASGQDPNDPSKTVQGYMRFNQRTGVGEFVPGPTPTARTAAGGANPDGVLSDDAVDVLSDRVIAGDATALHNIGRGAQSSVNLARIQNRVAQKVNDKGKGGSDIVAAGVGLQGDKAGARTVGTRLANMEIAATEASKMADLVVDTSSKVSRTDFQPANAAIIAWRNNTGDPDTVKYGASLNSFINAYSRAISGMSGGTVSDKEHAREMLGKAQSHDQVLATIDQLKLEMKAALESPPEVRQRMLDAVRNIGKDNVTLPSKAAPAALPNGPAKINGGSASQSNAAMPIAVTTQEQYDALPSGTRYLHPDGQTKVKP